MREVTIHISINKIHGDKRALWRLHREDDDDGRAGYQRQLERVELRGDQQERRRLDEEREGQPHGLGEMVVVGEVRWAFISAVSNSLGTWEPRLLLRLLSPLASPLPLAAPFQFISNAVLSLATQR